MDRNSIEQLPPRGSFELGSIEIAQAADGVRRIKGIANTFSVMRSGRMIHPQAIEAWLAKNPAAKLPLLAQHGYVPTFATIGLVDTLKVQRAKGLYFEATLGTGTPLMDEAWQLISQKLLGSISIGWIGKQARWVREDDADIDPWVAQQLKKDAAKEAYVFFGAELLEVSLVDVGDDRGGKLAARPEAAALEAALGPLRTELASIRRELDRLAAAGGAAEAAALTRDLFQEFLAAFRDAAIELLQRDANVGDAVEAYRADLEAGVFAGTDPLDSLRDAVSRIGGGGA